jgi:hypothetical protein
VLTRTPSFPAAALLLNVAAAVAFLLRRLPPGRLVARTISGVGIGAVAASEAWHVELHAERRRAEIVAAAASGRSRSGRADRRRTG